MKVADYFEAIKDRLFIAAFVAEFKIIKQVERSKNGHLRARVTFTDHSRLEFSEFVAQNAVDEIQVVTYSYHWSDENDALICRWDNTPHFPHLDNAPHHIHRSAAEVFPGQPVDIFSVLDEIEALLKQ